MRLLIANSEAASRALEEKAQAWLEADVARYSAGQWSEIYVSADGSRFGIAYEDRLAPAFSDSELGAQSSPDGMGGTLTTFNNVQDATMATENTPGWSVVPKPVVIGGSP